MKKKYLAPRIEIATCILDSFIATSPNQGGDSNLPDATKPIEPTDEIGELHSKQFDAWTTWDE